MNAFYGVLHITYHIFASWDMPIEVYYERKVMTMRNLYKLIKYIANL